MSPDCFALGEVALPDLKNGEALVRVKLINIHSNTRTRMATMAIPMGSTGEGNYACAEVVASRTSVFKEGDIIACQAGWQECQVVTESSELRSA